MVGMLLAVVVAISDALVIILSNGIIQLKLKFAPGGNRNFRDIFFLLFLYIFYLLCLYFLFIIFILFTYYFCIFIYFFLYVFIPFLE